MNTAKCPFSQINWNWSQVKMLQWRVSHHCGSKVSFLTEVEVTKVFENFEEMLCNERFRQEMPKMWPRKHVCILYLKIWSNHYCPGLGISILKNRKSCITFSDLLTLTAMFFNTLSLFIKQTGCPFNHVRCCMYQSGTWKCFNDKTVEDIRSFPVIKDTPMILYGKQSQGAKRSESLQSHISNTAYDDETLSYPTQVVGHVGGHGIVGYIYMCIPHIEELFELCTILITGIILYYILFGSHFYGYIESFTVNCFQKE